MVKAALRMTTSACPSETILVAYAEGRSANEERTLVEAHMTACADCRTIVSMLVKDDGRSTTDPFARTLAVDALSEPPPSSKDFSPGEMFEEKYRVERMIGAGGMGVVAEATHLGLGRRVAIKFMRAESRSNPEGAVRFLREARACANLSSDHVVRVFDNGMSKHGDPYLVMELLRGEDLAELLKREKMVDPGRAVRWVVEACDAIGEAHQLGIVHRDLKPANLFLSEGKGGDKKIKVLDFGISKLIGEGSFGGLTSQSAMLGSPRYMSPEQTRSSARADARTDIWALGVVLFELMTGTTPFDAENAVGLAAAIMTQAAPRLRERRPDASPALEKIVMRCLEKNPEDRFDSISSLTTALSSYASRATLPPPKQRSFLAPVVAGIVAAGAFVAVAIHFQAPRRVDATALPAAAQSPEIPITTTTPTSIAAPTVSATATASAIASAAPSASTNKSHAAPLKLGSQIPSKSSHSSASAIATTKPSEDMPGMSDRK
jgi:eukaryotic-like serine/threonine-protein kinase